MNPAGRRGNALRHYLFAYQRIDDRRLTRIKLSYEHQKKKRLKLISRLAQKLQIFNGPVRVWQSPRDRFHAAQQVQGLRPLLFCFPRQHLISNSLAILALDLSGVICSLSIFRVGQTPFAQRQHLRHSMTMKH
jgi:hypothetical protein